MSEITWLLNKKLFQGIDDNYNVTDMPILLEVIQDLENSHLTLEELEATRLGKHINELRRRISDQNLAARAKGLIKKWRTLLPSRESPLPPPPGAEKVRDTPSPLLTPKTIPSMTPPEITSTAISPMTLLLGNKSVLIKKFPKDGGSSTGTSPVPASGSDTSPSESRSSSPNILNNTPTPVSLQPQVESNKPLSLPAPSSVHTLVRRGNLSPTAPAPTPKKRLREEDVCHLGNPNKKPILSPHPTQPATKEFNSDTLSEQMLRATAARTSKLVRNHGDPLLPREKPNQLMERFFMSQQNEERLEGAPKTSIIATEAETRREVLTLEATIEELENQLPIVDHTKAMEEWLKTQDYPKEEGVAEEREVTQELIGKLNEGELEHVGGLRDNEGIFREWHEMASLVSLKGELLYTLPYCVIDDF